MTIAKIYAAGKVRRWHANPALADTGQTNADHQGACVQLLLMLHPAPSRALIRAVALHDVGERWVGDVPFDFKVAEPAAAKSHAQAEAQARWQAIGVDPVAMLTDEDHVWLKLVDRLEAFCHVAIARPDELTRNGWPEAIAWLRGQASLWCDHMMVEQLIDDMLARAW